MKKIYLGLLLIQVGFVNGQTTFDFSNDPLLNGWTYYDDYSSSPTPGFSYDPTNERINYQLNTSVETSILHTQLSSPLSDNFCISFQITPTNSSNYNTFFPLILTPYEQTGTDKHPWRQNPISSTTAGPVQNIDFLAVEVYSNQLRFFNRNGNVITTNSIQTMSPPFYLQSNITYWVKLEISNSTTAILSVFQDAGLSIELGSTTYSIPSLEAMNHLYIANSNGNTNCTQFGYLDDYQIDNCSRLSIENNQLSLNSSEKKLLKICNLLGQETLPMANTPLLYLYNDGRVERKMIVE